MAFCGKEAFVDGTNAGLEEKWRASVRHNFWAA